MAKQTVGGLGVSTKYYKIRVSGDAAHGDGVGTHNEIRGGQRRAPPNGDTRFLEGQLRMLTMVVRDTVNEALAAASREREGGGGAGGHTHRGEPSGEESRAVSQAC